jgi:hypothetical protein
LGQKIMTDIADILQSLSIILACLSVILGIDAWRREFIGKRKIELAEDVLTRFYEARDAIARIRNPMSFENERSSRKRAPHERDEESNLLDQAYVVFVRYEKEQDLFNRIHALRYNVMARLGLDAAKPFNVLHGVVNEIFRAAHMLGSHYWPRQGRVSMSETEFKKHLAEMHKHEAVFWAGYDENDLLQKRIDEVIAAIEQVCRPVLVENSVGFILTEPFARIFRKK